MCYCFFAFIDIKYAMRHAIEANQKLFFAKSITLIGCVPSDKGISFSPVKPQIDKGN